MESKRKLVLVMRGLPGSGKSTYLQKILDELREEENLRGLPEPGRVLRTICSADDFHMKDGKYQFDPKNAPIAHRECLRQFLAATQRGDSLVVVDNTNVSQWEYVQYVNIAQVHDYDVRIIEFDTPVEVSIERNIHGVPAEVIRGMAARWEEVLPWHRDMVVVNSVESTIRVFFNVLEKQRKEKLTD